MSTLRRRHALMRSLRGQIPGDGRKTFTRRFRRAPSEMPDWRLTVLIPEAFALGAPGAGRTAIAGVTVEPDPFSGPLAVATGKGLEWVLTAMGRFLLSIADGAERIITGSLIRGDEIRGQAISIQPDRVEFAMRGGKTITVTA